MIISVGTRFFASVQKSVETVRAPSLVFYAAPHRAEIVRRFGNKIFIKFYKSIFYKFSI